MTRAWKKVPFFRWSFWRMANEGKRFRTKEHETHVEYQKLLKDLVLESEYLASA